MAEFYLTKDSAKNTSILRKSDNELAYTIKTSINLLRANTTTIYKEPGQDPVGIVELHEYHDHVVQVGGKSYLPQKTHEASHYADPKEFTASNGCRYKWKGNQKVWELLTQDKTQTVVALCNQGDISIYTQAILDIVDEVIVTLIYMRQSSDNEKEDILAAGLVGGGA